MGTLFVDNIKQQSSQGSGTITIGASGETVALASGVNQSNMLYPSFRVQPSASQNVGDSSFTKLNYNTEIWDTDSAYDTSAYRFTVPSGKAGKYFMSASVGIRNAGTINVLDIAFYVNGSQDRTFRRYHQSSGTSNQYQASVLSATLQLAASDYVELYMYQNVGSNVEVNAQGSNLDTFWYGFRIGT